MGRWWEFFLNDFCPQNNRWAVWRSPVGVLFGVVLLAFVCATYTSSNGLIVALTLLVVAVAGLLWPFVSIAGVSACVQFNRQRGREAEPIGVRVQIRNHWPWPVFGLGIDLGWVRTREQDRPAPGQPLRPADLHLPWLAGWSSITLEQSVRPPCRGVYPVQPPLVWCGFPFGLWYANRRLTVPLPLLVWPGRVPVREFADSGDRATISDHCHDRAGHAGETIGVREYRRGDALARIHWRQTARHRRLIVREQQSPTTPWLLIELDIDARHHSGTGPQSSLERAIRLAGSFAESAWQRGTQVELKTALGTVGPARQEVLDALAQLPTDFVPQLSSATITDAETQIPTAIDPNHHHGYGKSRTAPPAKRLLITTDQALRSACDTKPASQIQMEIIRTEPLALQVTTAPASILASGNPLAATVPTYLASANPTSQTVGKQESLYAHS